MDVNVGISPLLTCYGRHSIADIPDEGVHNALERPYYHHGAMKEALLCASE